MQGTVRVLLLHIVQISTLSKVCRVREAAEFLLHRLRQD